MARRPQAVPSGTRGSIPGWVWMAFGLVLGLGLAVFLMIAGLMPGGPMAEPDGPVAERVEPVDEIELTEDADDWKPTFDFYSVLPEKEVVIPAQEIRQRAGRDEPDEGVAYLVQVGSFTRFEDADELKASLALLGLQAGIAEVEINDTTYYRVRLGPYATARQTDEVKRRLQDNQYDALVLAERG